MHDRNIYETPSLHRKIRIIALMEPDEAAPNAATAVGFMVDAPDTASLARTLQALHEGNPTSPGSTKRVRVTVHEDGTLGEDRQLSPRELQVLCGLVRGLSYKMIAHELNISFETVRTHVKGIYLKLNVNNNTAAVAKAIHSGLAAA